MSASEAYLAAIGARSLPPRTAPFDPGYLTRRGRKSSRQSAHLMATIRLRWRVGRSRIPKRHAPKSRPRATRESRQRPEEAPRVAVAQGQLPLYLDLCASFGFQRIECGEGFTTLEDEPRSIIQAANERGLAVQYEVGPKHDGPMTKGTIKELLDRAARWLDGGAVQIVVEARESAVGVGLFDEQGALDPSLAHAFADRSRPRPRHLRGSDEIESICVPESLRAQRGPLECTPRRAPFEIYRRGLHSDAFSQPNLTPARSVTADVSEHG